MASSGLGDGQNRKRHGPSGGKVTFNKQTRKQGMGGGGSQAVKNKAVTGVMSVHSKGGHKPGPGKANRRWRPNQQQVFVGSAKEGKGFALWRKQKVQLEYKKLQRKQKKATAAKDLYADSYPEHLKHLYLAEEERLKNLERKRKPEEDSTKTTEEEEKEEVVVPKKKFKNKTSNQKAKEEYERVQRERAKKKKEAEENRKKREAAKELYKKKKMEAFKVLNTKTKKGQPNFNVQMEYLLKKIQSKT